jgi:hypothetical protein
MIILIHLLEHLGVPSGVAIGVVIAVMKVVKGGGAKLRGRRDGTFPAGKTPYGDDENSRDKR